jgi:hypothetical protein
VRHTTFGRTQQEKKTALKLGKEKYIILKKLSYLVSLEYLRIVQIRGVANPITSSLS